MVLNIKPHETPAQISQPSKASPLWFIQAVNQTRANFIGEESGKETEQHLTEKPDIQHEFDKQRSELLAELKKYPAQGIDWADEISANSYECEGISAETLREIFARGEAKGLRRATRFITWGNWNPKSLSRMLRAEANKLDPPEARS
jgi:hypothetical protein